ncbi:hypothetical protein LOAG_05963 [Loa loa]|uniref:Uncharacterized protein n=1 Tax=Loa loa TaxID=7209 RepID=A0A1S0TZD7_LOALO|nr:hypothetical protein LOAG_05963 [Loa loa]EFO22526.1 hypothetical protein LOAG_05963 [Loa loa]
MKRNWKVTKGRDVSPSEQISNMFLNACAVINDDICMIKKTQKQRRNMDKGNRVASQVQYYWDLRHTSSLRDEIDIISKVKTLDIEVMVFYDVPLLFSALNANDLLEHTLLTEITDLKIIDLEW